jgi:SAM-dependent methyltransferase
MKTGLFSRLVPQSIKRLVADYVRRTAERPPQTFPDIAYLPYAQGQSGYVLPLPAADRRAGHFPDPPGHLQLHSNSYEAGERLTSQMLAIVEQSGFSFAGRGRILDFGCGDGRLIRHLHHLAERWEIWGADISADRIYWCSENLSPPFNFVVNTKAPHLPFKDGSFDFIFCGSLFTHIDDLAKAWLLELHRLLSPDGRLYVTIHDKHTKALFDSPEMASFPTQRNLSRQEIYRGAGESFGMMTVGRDHLSQVFYDLDFFRAMVTPALEVLSVHEEAFNLQTAVLLRPRPQGLGNVEDRQS